jgi:hypothetical protein
MPKNTLLIRSVAVLVGIAALLFIFGEAMSVWRGASEARKADVGAAALAANRDEAIEKKRAELRAGVTANFEPRSAEEKAIAQKAIAQEEIEKMKLYDKGKDQALKSPIVTAPDGRRVHEIGLVPLSEFEPWVKKLPTTPSLRSDSGQELYKLEPDWWLTEATPR